MTDRTAFEAWWMTQDAFDGEYDAAAAAWEEAVKREREAIAELLDEVRGYVENPGGSKYGESYKLHAELLSRIDAARSSD